VGEVGGLGRDVAGPTVSPRGAGPPEV
jgi:hypothetical protein